MASGGGSTGGGTARSTQFRATHVRFSVPLALYNALNNQASGLNARNWSTLDLNGDGRLDLALTSNPATGAIFNTAGTTHWNVHLGNANGFSPIVTQWVVPANASLPQGYTSTDSATTPYFWATFDVSGDGRPDLVHTMNPISMGPYVSTVGATTDGWLLRRGVGVAFEPNAGTMTIPRVPGLGGGIDRLTNDTVSRRWALARLVGAASLDLVITADPASDMVWQASTTPTWQVCAGTVAGFGAFTNCLRLRVPDSGTPGGFRSASTLSAPQRRVWLLVDMNGDGLDDLVQSLNPAGALDEAFTNAGAPFWKVWLNQTRVGPADTLFAATPLEWSVPGTTYASPSSATGNRFWQLMDLDGDGLQELVLTADPLTGQPFFGPSWRVYATNPTRTGFQQRATGWAIPLGPLPDGFRSVSGAGWAVLDATNDGLPDLVQFQDPATGNAFTDASGAYWRVFPGVP